jgi:site-specific recombinase XerD
MKIRVGYELVYDFPQATPRRFIGVRLFVDAAETFGILSQYALSDAQWHLSRAGLDGATSHSGRRSFITTLASKGIGVRVLASLAGHESIATTQAYIHVNDEMKRAAVELVS